MCQAQAGCSNVGTYSCDRCGHLACGRHNNNDGYSTTNICSDCRAYVERTTTAGGGGYCALLVLGALMIVASIVMAAIKNGPEFELLLIAGIACIAGGFIYSKVKNDAAKQAHRDPRDS
jgi:predicted phage tail protein